MESQDPRAWCSADTQFLLLRYFLPWCQILHAFNLCSFNSVC